VKWLACVTITLNVWGAGHLSTDYCCVCFVCDWFRTHGYIALLGSPRVTYSPDSSSSNSSSLHSSESASSARHLHLGKSDEPDCECVINLPRRIRDETKLCIYMLYIVWLSKMSKLEELIVNSESKHKCEGSTA
jgi:hypothetical protein